MESILILMYLLVPFGTVEEFYLGGGTGLVNYSHESTPDYDMYGAHFRLGHHYYEHLAAEVRFGASTVDRKPINGTGTDASLKSFGAAYVRGFLPIEGNIKPYAMVGFSKANIDHDPSANAEDKSDSGMSYGLGIDYKFNTDKSISLEYASLMDTSKIGEINTLTLNFIVDIEP